MPNIYNNISKNVTKTWVLMTVFFAVVILLGYFFSVYYGNPNILYFFVIFCCLVVRILGLFFSFTGALSHQKAGIEICITSTGRECRQPSRCLPYTRSRGERSPRFKHGRSCNPLICPGSSGRFDWLFRTSVSFFRTMRALAIRSAATTTI